MKFAIRFLVTIILLVAVGGMYAQERAITDKEYKDAESLSLKQLRGKKYRRTMTSEVFRRSGTTKSVSIWELAPPDRERTFLKYSEGARTSTTETIRIGGETYIRKDEGDWTILASPDGGRFTVSGTGGGQGRPIEPKRERTQKFEPGVRLGNELADLYRQNETFIFDNGKTLAERKIWISKAGLPLRTESRTSDENGNPIHYLVLVYEYDQDFKIEAPNILADK